MPAVMSLTARSFSAAFISLVIFIPLATLALERAFVSSLTEAVFEELRVHGLTLMSDFEPQQRDSLMPEHLANDEFNLPGSGLAGFIFLNQQLVWRSDSSLTLPLPNGPVPALGQAISSEWQMAGTDYFYYAYGAEYPLDDDYVPVTFVVLKDRQRIAAELEAFRNALWTWLGGLSVLLVVLLLFSLRQALRPIDELIRQIRAIEAGKQQELHGQLPKELDMLKSRLNRLLVNERTQRERYKNSLSDLAHSLKTPLAVLSASPDLPTGARAPVQQIDGIISRQLKRASAQINEPSLIRAKLLPLVEQLVHAMEKIYADASVSYSHLLADDLQVAMDKTDLLEVLGNLIDNASKAAAAQVHIAAHSTQGQVRLWVEDDGPGIPAAEQQRLLTRGVRLDSYADGQGIGLAVVMDILAAYDASLSFLPSPLGGTRVELYLPGIPST